MAISLPRRSAIELTIEALTIGGTGWGK